ncbi:MAG: hypothetical protein Q7T14_05625, partial [Aestuariivirga sp.]|nr:hypothetical protein [Aestuariivirga sp.]
MKIAWFTIDNLNVAYAVDLRKRLTSTTAHLLDVGREIRGIFDNETLRAASMFGCMFSCSS